MPEFERAGGEAREREGGDLAQQPRQRAGVALDQRLPERRRRQARIADRPLRVEVLRRPGEAREALGVDPRAGAGTRREPRGAHLRRPQVEHHRRLRRPAVDAVAALGFRHQVGDVGEGPVAHRDDQQRETRAQLARDDVHRRRVAAMRVEQHQPTQAGARHALPDLRPHPQQGLAGEVERAGEGEVLGRMPHRQQRQGEQRELGRRELERAREQASGEVGVDRQRQVRAVLLDRAQRQHGDRAIAVEGGELVGGQVGPAAGRRAHARLV